MATVASAAAEAAAHIERQKQMDLEIEKVFLALEGKDLRRALAEVIVQLRHQRSCRHDVRY